MLFAHDTERALAGVAALVNTAGPPDTLRDPVDLDAFADEWRWTGHRSRDRAELIAVQALRPRLRQLWDADADAAAAVVNAMLVAGHALPQLVRHDDWGYHLHATPDDAPLADRMAVEAAMSMVDVIRQGELDRLGTCAADDCDNVLVDLSKNRSKRFCGTACANRVNVANFRARRAVGTAATASSSAAT